METVMCDFVCVCVGVVAMEMQKMVVIMEYPRPQL